MTALHKASMEPPENRMWPLPSACTERDAETGLPRNVLMLFSADASAAKAKWTVVVGKAGGRQRRGSAAGKHFPYGCSGIIPFLHPYACGK